MPESRREKGDEGKGQHDTGHRQIDEGHGGEYQDWGQERDQELRQELTEIGFKLLNAVDQRQADGPGPLAPDRARPQCCDPVVDRPAQGLLDDTRGRMGNHGAPVFEGAAQNHDQRDERDRQHE